jgi:two-component system invasion response regulator UvrY
MPNNIEGGSPPRECARLLEVIKIRWQYVQNIPDKKMSILIVDDHELVREGIAQLLGGAQDIVIVGQVSSGEEALEYLSSARSGSMNAHGSAGFTSSSYQIPDIILLDARMPGLRGIEATRAILKLSPDYKILAMSSLASGIIPAQMLRSGARGFITKSVSVEELLKAVRTVAAGGNYVTPSIAKRLATDHFGDEAGGLFDKLSQRELQISHMLTEGKKVSQISANLELSPKRSIATVTEHSRNWASAATSNSPCSPLSNGLAGRCLRVNGPKNRFHTVST